MHCEGGIPSTREGRRGFRASVVVRFLFWGMAYCFRPRRCPLVYPCAYKGLPRLRNRSARVFLRQSGASGGCMPRRVRRLAGDAEAVGALACFAHLLDLLLPALRTVFVPLRQRGPAFGARRRLLRFPFRMPVNTRPLFVLLLIGRLQISRIQIGLSVVLPASA